MTQAPDPRTGIQQIMPQARRGRVGPVSECLSQPSPRLVSVPEQQVAPAVRTAEVVDSAAPWLAFGRCVRGDHVGRDRRVAAVHVVLAQKCLDVATAREHGKLALSDLAEVRRRHAAMLRPLVVLPRLKPVYAWKLGVFVHRDGLTRYCWMQNGRVGQCCSYVNSGSLLSAA